MDEEKIRIENALSGDTWKIEFQGKNIFSMFCSSAFNEDKLKIRQAYIDIALAEKPAVFDDIKTIFESFV